MNASDLRHPASDLRHPKDPRSRRRVKLRFGRSSALGWAIAVAALAMGLAPGCTDDSAWNGGPDHPTGPRAYESGTALVSLRALGSDGVSADGPSTSCEDELARLQRAHLTALRANQQVGRDGSVAMEDRAAVAPSQSGASPSDAASSGAAPPNVETQTPSGEASATTSDVVGTNVQEAGVDEADIIKTDGRVIVTLANGAMHVTEIDDDPKVDGTLQLRDIGGDTQMYLVGANVFLVATSYGRSDLYTDDVIVDDIPGGSIMRGGGWSTDGGPDAGTTSGDARPDWKSEPAEPSDTRPTDSDLGTSLDSDDPLVTVPGSPAEPWMPTGPLTVLTQVDISDPTSPTLVASMTIDGELTSSRSVRDTIHVVISSFSPQVLPLAFTESDGDWRQLGECSDVMVETVADTGSGDAPIDSTGDDTAGTVAGPTVGSAEVDPGTISVLSFKDLTGEIRPTVIEGTGGIVYGSTDSLYVASPMWARGVDATAIHRFDLTSGGPPPYVATGTVPGQLLNQFSLSEYESALRVVTTVEPTAAASPEPGRPGPDPAEPALPNSAVPGVEPLTTPSAEPSPMVRAQPESQRTTHLTTLAKSDLHELGGVGNLAPGESVRSSRFIGPMAYVVTFLQTDPLFAIDVSDPRAPRVIGQLEIPGFSEYLHPVGDGLLLGVGRDVDPESLIDRGLKLSLFDVSNPARPSEIDTWTRPDAYSQVSDDHHAFTWDAERHAAILPVEGPCPTDRPDGGNLDMESYCGKAIVFTVDGGRITESNSIVHPVGNTDGGEPGSTMAMPTRAIITGHTLWTLSQVGLGHSNVESPERVRVIDFN